MEKKDPRIKTGVFSLPLNLFWDLTQNSDIDRLQSFGSIGDFKLHFVAFVKGFKTIFFDGREMDKNITIVLS